MDGQRLQRLRMVAGLLLIAGLIALAAPPFGQDWAPLTWDGLLAPYSSGAEISGGFRIKDIRRVDENDLRIAVAASDGSTAAEIHVVPRGCWTGVPESTSFGIAYATLQSPAPEREAIRDALATAIRAGDSGLPPPDAIALRSGFDPLVPMGMLRGWPGILLLVTGAWLLSVPFIRTRRMLIAAAAVGLIAMAARLSGLLFAAPAVCPAGQLTGLDLGVRALQVLWILFILTGPLLCWRAGVACGVGGKRMLLAVIAATLLSTIAIWNRGDEPLHANAHAWRTAREVLLPLRGGRDTGSEAFLHGKAAPALAWLVAAGEDAVTGAVNPFRISRIAGAAASGACVLLVAVLVGSASAGLAAGVAMALTPLAQMYNVSGSPLAVSAMLLPWSLGLLVAAATSGDRVLLWGAALAAGLGSLSHTGMLVLFPAMVLAWVLVPRPPIRRSGVVWAAGVYVGITWVSGLLSTYRMVEARNQAHPLGLLGAAEMGLTQRNLFLDPEWVSPLLLPLAVLGGVAGALYYGATRLAVPLAALLLAVVPFFAVIQCSSDAVRYQGTLLGLLTSLAVIGAWAATTPAIIGDVVRTAVRLALIGGLVILPLSGWRPPTDPAVVEHRLVAEAVRQMQTGTLVVLPRSGPHGLMYDFPDFLLPENSRVVFAGDPAIDAHRGPTVAYLGLSCIAVDNPADAETAQTMREECRRLQMQGEPWVVRTLSADEVPRERNGAPWTYHAIANQVPFGFFTLRSADAATQR